MKLSFKFEESHLKSMIEIRCGVKTLQQEIQAWYFDNGLIWCLWFVKNSLYRNIEGFVFVIFIVGGSWKWRGCCFLY